MSANDLRHEFETRSPPALSPLPITALPSISLIPSARFTNSHEGNLHRDFSHIVIVRLLKIRVISVWPLPRPPVEIKRPHEPSFFLFTGARERKFSLWDWTKWGRSLWRWRPSEPASCVCR